MESSTRIALLTAFALASSACDTDGSSITVPDGDTAGDTSDTSDADTGDTTPSDIERLDWTAERGPALDATEVTVAKKAVVAVHPDGFLLGGDCEAELGCDYAFHDATGALIATRDDRYLVYGRVVPRTADQILWVAREAYELCGPGPNYPTVVSGVLELVSLANPEPLWTERVRTNVYSDPGFSATGRWFRSEPLAPGLCDGAPTRWLEARAPFAPPTFRDARVYFDRELLDGRWLAWRDETFGVLDPDRQSSFIPLGDKVDGFAVGAGWVHAFDGYGDTTDVVRSLAPDGARHDLTLSSEAVWRGKAGRGRWVEVCKDTELPTVDVCQLHDVTGAHAPREVSLRPSSLVFLAHDVGLYVADDDDEPVLVRIDLTTGDRQIVARGPGDLHLLGDQDAALWQGAELLLVDPTRTQILLPHPVTQVVTVASANNGGGLFEGGATPPRPRQLATIIDAPETGRYRLHLFDLTTRRLVTLTDQLFYAPVLAAPLAADTCGQPWTLRSAGNGFDGYEQDARTFFFVEHEPGGFALYLVPIDLSSPPRRLASVDQVACHPPLESPDGALVVLANDAFDGSATRLTLTTSR